MSASEQQRRWEQEAAAEVDKADRALQTDVEVFTVARHVWNVTQVDSRDYVSRRSVERAAALAILGLRALQEASEAAREAHSPENGPITTHKPGPTVGLLPSEAAGIHPMPSETFQRTVRVDPDSPLGPLLRVTEDEPERCTYRWADERCPMPANHTGRHVFHDYHSPEARAERERKAKQVQVAEVAWTEDGTVTAHVEPEPTRCAHCSTQIEARGDVWVNTLHREMTCHQSPSRRHEP